MPFDPNLRNTSIFLAIFILAFFPSAFQFLLRLPLLPLRTIGLLDPRTETQLEPLLPTCACCPPSSCNPHTQPVDTGMSWFQKTFTLAPRSRGSYLISDEITSQLPELKGYKVGILHLFVQHTSCGLTLNENWDRDVRADMSDALDQLVPEDRMGKFTYRHDAEGPDDMPAHIKSSLVGASVTVPIKDGRLALGTWQGIWYCEFRASKHSRKVVATIQGEKM